MEGPQDITRLFAELREGRKEALDRILPLVYDELRGVAHRRLEQDDGATLRTTELVHEAYLKLVEHGRVKWRDRGHFFAVAAMAMRQILVDRARERRAEKRGGGQVPLSLEEEVLAVEEQAEALLDLDEALTRLAGLDARLARVVECRFFGGLTDEETAEALGLTARTVRRDWVKARGLLYAALRR
jgi:RNA polymerase sigma factor (TIGR02999 family)